MCSFCSLVDILGENKSLPVECQCEPPHDESRIAGKPEAIFHSCLIAKAGMLKTDAAPKTLRLAGCRVGSYTGGPANWRFQRWGDRLGSPSLGFQNAPVRFQGGIREAGRRRSGRDDPRPDRT